VPTLGRKGSKRIKRLDPNSFLLIVVDEAHHAVAKTYTRILEYFDLFHPETNKLLVGFTATPKRGDGIGLDEIFEEIVYSRTLPEMIEEGYLAPVAGYRVETDIDLSGVKVRMGDFVTSQLSRAVNVKTRNELIVEVYKSFLKNKKTLIFCVDVEHAHHLAAAFNENRIPAAAITGNTESANRARIREEFHSGKLDVLTNCMVLTEGYDEPSVMGIILARPTRSQLLYIQMIGRGTRLYPGKQNVTIIDIVDVTRKHKLITLPTLFGLSENFNLEGHTISDAENAIQWVETNRPWIQIDNATSMSDLRFRCKKIDLLDLQTPTKLSNFAQFAWVGFGNGGYRLGLAEDKAFIAAPTILDEWELIFREQGQDKTIQKSKSLFKTIVTAEHYINKNFKDMVGLVKRNSRWRRQPASEKQVQLLQHKKIQAPEGLTKGQASHIISMLS